MAAPITYLHIDSDPSYFDTRAQIELKAMRPESVNTDNGLSKRQILPHTIFVDSTGPNRSESETFAVGFFSKQRNQAISQYNVTNKESSYYPTGSTVIDASGNDRKILSTNIDIYASSSVDGYKNGVEIRTNRHWDKGFVKITAGTSGHLLEKTLYGVKKFFIKDPNTYYDLDTLDPATFVKTPQSYVNQPIIIGDPSEIDVYGLDGAIEGMPLRTMLSFASLYYPRDPSGFRVSFEGGGYGRKDDSNIVTSIDYFSPKQVNKTPYVDASDPITFYDSDDQTNYYLNSSVITFFKDDNNLLEPWRDEVNPRNEERKSTYSNDLWQALNQMLSGTVFSSHASNGVSYVSSRQKTAATGFVYDSCTLGTDSIAYGGLAY